jgi:PAS domain S-box-containing protein
MNRRNTEVSPSEDLKAATTGHPEGRVSSNPVHAEEIYSAMFESAPEPMITADSQGSILQVNVEASRLFGYEGDELIGQSVERLMPEFMREIHAKHREAFQGASGFRQMAKGQENFAIRKDGTTFPIDISFSPVSTPNGRLVYLIIRDLSERNAALKVERNLKFERALSGISTMFVNLPVERVDDEVSNGLRLLGETLEIDRANLGQVDPATGDLVITHWWVREGVPPHSQRIVRGFLPWLDQRLMKGLITWAEKPEDLPPEAAHEREYMLSAGAKSSLVVPFRVGGQVIGAMSTDTFRHYHQWDDAIISRVQDISDIFANALSRKRADEALQKAYGEIRQLKERLEQENTYLREEISLQHSHLEIVGDSAAIRTVLKRAEQVAATDSAVLILGETGTGKELIARTIHELSARNKRSMVKINCAALPSTLIESELFGREKGAFTGALAREIGRFELADKSTIFLDEVGEMPLELQSKLLRVLQEGQFERLGSSKTIQADVRVVAATNRDLKAMVKEGRFRQDLFYRLNVFPITIPPLRERAEDIPSLVWHILRDLGKKMGRNVQGVHPDSMQAFQRYSWPGNIRELRNVIERSLILNTGDYFRAELSDLESAHAAKGHALSELESEQLRHILVSTRWRVRGKGGAAEVLGLKPTTLEARLKKLGIQRPV